MRRCLRAALCGALVLGVTACGGTRNQARGILFIRNTGDFSRIYVWRAGAAPLPVGPKGYSIDSVAWSPNGKEIAFEAQQGGLGSEQPFAIYEMPADGGHAHELISDPKTFGVDDPIWSPDGSRMLYRRLDGAKQFIFSIRTGHKQPLHTYIGTGAWGRAGIAYVGPDYRTIMLFDPRTGISSVFAKTKVYPGDEEVPGWGAGYPTWVRGGRLAVVDDSRTIFVYSSHGRPVAQFAVPRRGKACGMVSSPDGTELLVSTVTDTAALHWTTNLDGTQWKRLPFKGGAGSCEVSWR